MQKLFGNSSLVRLRLGALFTAQVSSGTDTYMRVKNKHGMSFEITTGGWSACSVTCGGGKQTRELFCKSEMGTDSSLERSFSCFFFRTRLRIKNQGWSEKTLHASFSSF